jgi:hypothetical protein
MNTKQFVSLLSSIWLAAGSFCLAATVPAGTAITVRTNAPISSHAATGRHFTATVDQNVVANGNVALRAGTHVTGLIQSSRGSRSTTSSSPLTLVLTGVPVNGKTVHIKTSPVQPKGAKTTRASRGGFSFGENVFPAGTKLEFHLTQPLHL